MKILINKKKKLKESKVSSNVFTHVHTLSFLCLGSWAASLLVSGGPQLWLKGESVRVVGGGKSWVGDEGV